MKKVVDLSLGFIFLLLIFIAGFYFIISSMVTQYKMSTGHNIENFNVADLNAGDYIFGYIDTYLYDVESETGVQGTITSEGRTIYNVFSLPDNGSSYIPTYISDPHTIYELDILGTEESHNVYFEGKVTKALAQIDSDWYMSALTLSDEEAVSELVRQDIALLAWDFSGNDYYLIIGLVLIAISVAFFILNGGFSNLVHHEPNTISAVVTSDEKILNALLVNTKILPHTQVKQMLESEKTLLRMYNLKVKELNKSRGEGYILLFVGIAVYIAFSYSIARLLAVLMIVFALRKIIIALYNSSNKFVLSFIDLFQKDNLHKRIITAQEHIAELETVLKKIDEEAEKEPIATKAEETFRLDNFRG